MRLLLIILFLLAVTIVAVYLARWNSKRAIRAEERNRELEEQVDILAHDQIERDELQPRRDRRT